MQTSMTILVKTMKVNQWKQLSFHWNVIWIEIDSNYDIEIVTKWKPLFCL